MLGFSIYLGKELTKQDYDYLLSMKKNGFSEIFTSLQIPEEDPKMILKQANLLADWCQELEISVVADVSEKGLARLGIDFHDGSQLQSLGLTGFRIDDGIEMDEVAKLSQEFLIALNASTISQDDIDQLKANNANFDNLEAWHNYYPRPETGLDKNWVLEKNRWLQSQNLKTMAFVPGDENKRGPIYAGLPTLEQDRTCSPLAGVIDLKSAACDHIFIGDPGLTPYSRKAINNFYQNHCITLRIDQPIAGLVEHEWHNRPDVARDVVRLKEGRIRKLFNVEPNKNNLPRVLGTITVDNCEYGRYQQELQIVKRNLPMDPKVNILAHVIKEDCPILNKIESNQKIKFEYVD